MSNVPSIESRNLSVSEVFQDFYLVPDFQREYVWQEDNVKKLLNDLFDGIGLYEVDSSHNFSEYFLGSIVVYPDTKTEDKKTFQLIDGQQRLTTIYLIFCAIRDYIKRLGDKSKAVENLIKGIAQDIHTGEDIDKYRLSLQNDSYGQKVIDQILISKKVDKLTFSCSQSSKNLYKAWQIVKEFLEDNIENDAKQFKMVCTAISNRVKIIRIETPNLKNALKVFETINERGLGLTPIDLLKNYLFIHTASNSDREKHWLTLTRKWEELLKNIYQSNQKPIQFLRYYILSHYTVDLSNNFPEEEIYDWFLDKGEEFNIQKNPIKFLDDLILASEHYCKFILSKNIDNSDNKYLKNISKIQGKVRQHLIILLGGRFLPIELFEKLSSYVENIFFVYALTRKTRRKDINVTREFSQWSRQLRKVESSEQLDEFITTYLFPVLHDLKEDFRLSLIGTSDSNLAKFRLRYMLGKISQFVEEEVYGSAKPIEYYLDKSITIEHILPISAGDPYAKKIGNLTLLEKTINSSIADKDFSHKKLGYQESQILLTRSLSQVPNVGHNTQLNRAIKQLGLFNFEQWNHETIEQRQMILVDIAMKVWGMDK
ncbi:MAG: DUF262 domain-containing protein [Spirulinaceae cyanobacterium]